MAIIVLRLEGPMQSWGTGSRFTDRYTEAEPSKSGVIGLLCSALGRLREDNIDDLVKIKMAVRVEREGNIVYDYQTTRNVLRANAKGAITPSKLGDVVSRRFYIADACFLVGIEEINEKLIKKISQSLKFPKWPLFLGKKSFPPSSPILLKNQILQKSLVEAIKACPWQGRDGDTHPPSLRLIHECEPNEGEPRIDVPISFRPRSFRSRYVKTEFIPFESVLRE